MMHQAKIWKIQVLRIIILVCLCLSPVRADLRRDINRIIATQKGVEFGVHVIKADTGKTVFEHQADNPMIPASNMKIVVSAAALTYLGPDFIYTTKVGYANGALVIIGCGDPLLGDQAMDEKYNRTPGWIFKNIIEQCLARGITEIKDIIIDSTAFDDTRVHSSWPAKDLNKWFAAEVCGLNYNDNCIDITVRNLSGKIQLQTEPQTKFLTLKNQVRPIKNGRGGVGAYRIVDQSNILIVRGDCRREQGFTVAIEKPATYFGFMLAESLVQAGISVTGQLIEQEFDHHQGWLSLTEFKTPLTDCLSRCNKDSLQLAAEALLKTLAAQAMPDGKGGSWPAGCAILSEFLKDMGIPEDMFVIDDACGLSRENRLTARSLTTTLRTMYQSEFWQIYRDSLAIGGVDGTIRKSFGEPLYKGNIWGKTGYINKVKSFSGVCRVRNGTYLFSILTYNARGTTRKAINHIAQAIIDNN